MVLSEGFIRSLGDLQQGFLRVLGILWDSKKFLEFQRILKESRDSTWSRFSFLIIYTAFSWEFLGILIKHSFGFLRILGTLQDFLRILEDLWVLEEGRLLKNPWVWVLIQASIGGLSDFSGFCGILEDSWKLKRILGPSKGFLEIPKNSYGLLLDF